MVTPLGYDLAYTTAGVGIAAILATFCALLAVIMRRSRWFVVITLVSAILGIISGAGLIVLPYFWSTGPAGWAPGYLMFDVGIVVVIISSLSIALTAAGYLRLK